jgi:hypothetical protein
LAREKASFLMFPECVQTRCLTGNAFRDVGHRSADVGQFKAVLQPKSSSCSTQERLTVGTAQVRTGIAAADFSRIRNADLARFAIDRIMSILNRLGSRVKFKI